MSEKVMPEDESAQKKPESIKAPSQVFRWFEKMKANYEHNVQVVLTRFEQYNEKQQLHLEQTNKNHVSDLKQSYQAQLQCKDEQISQLSQDVDYYKNQIAKQQQSMEQLNSRYDAVMRCLIEEKRSDITIKEIMSEDDFISPSFVQKDNAPSVDDNILDSPNNEQPTKEDININENLFEQAINKRKSGENDQAFDLFEQAAKEGHVKAMGAMGRAFFLGEGVEENPSIGLAWLIKAASLEHPHAIDRVQQYQESEPEFYQEALQLSAELC